MSSGAVRSSQGKLGEADKQKKRKKKNRASERRRRLSMGGRYFEGFERKKEL